MLSASDNHLLTAVGPGTPMGNLLRAYWLPGPLSDELPEADCPPVRFRLLAEDLIAFRTTSGDVGVVAEACPHRGASMFFGRNEEDGLRCVYHGWKFDTRGACVDMPNEPAESNFKHKVRATAYPAREVNGLVWVYMGPATSGAGEPLDPPPLPEFEWLSVPASHVRINKRVQESNFMQPLEGGIDSSHASFLHSEVGPTVDARYRSGETVAAKRYLAADKHPYFEVLERDYGLVFAARRRVEADANYWRVNLFLMPFYTMAPASAVCRCSAWVPIDDETTMRYTVQWDPLAPLAEVQRAATERKESATVVDTGQFLRYESSGSAWRRFRPAANKDNDYLIDRAVQREQNYTGISTAATEDQAVTESMGAIYNRSREHLGTADVPIIAARRLLLTAAKAMREAGLAAPGVLTPEAYAVRPAAFLLPATDDLPAALNRMLPATPNTTQAYL